MFADVLRFWFDDVAPAQWWRADPSFDAVVAQRFGALHAAASAGELSAWRAQPQGRLAELLVLDQFSRNIHRGTARAFASDAMALALAQEAVAGQHPRLRVEADVGGVPVKGAWQPAGGRWFLMLPKAALKQAGIAVGRVVDVAFKVLPPDDVDVPVELAAELAAKPKVRQAWAGLTAGTQRGLAHMVASAKRSDTRAKRAAQVVAVVLGEAPLPWSRK
jgi:Bacterial protein of unknown function (DUF924)/Bacteriocin-protection, YdeI or OmpD-Associated/Domain of unknown function (DUF1905)